VIRSVFLALVLLATPALAQVDLSNRWTTDPAWVLMDQAAAEPWIYNQILAYPDGATQFFAVPEAPGESTLTEYADGRPSMGQYTLIEGQYCSVWAPRAPWECYDLEAHEDGERIRFVSEDGVIYEARRQGG